MSELTLMLIRFAYLAILWIFVLSAISVIRSDMFGARIESTPRADRRADKRARRAQGSRPTKRPRGAPTHVAIVEGANEGSAAALMRRSASTTTTSPPGTPASRAPVTSGSWRTSAPPTAPISAPTG